MQISDTEIGISILHKYDYNDGVMHKTGWCYPISILHKYDYNSHKANHPHTLHFNFNST